MSRQEQQVRRELVVLAESGKGRMLLQLALRGIQESGRGLTYGCWVKPEGGVAGCLFQHAYWQGVREGAGFSESGLALGAELKQFVGESDFGLVTSAIRAFDALGRRRFRRWRRGRLGLPVHTLDEPAWRATIERILIDVLAATGPDDGTVREPVRARIA